ncbi:Ankyrin repeat-containing protein [Cladophialophora immunda]|nr:Ankyrin repeat-containing protein [Cladophialophora immunda]
MGDTRKTRFRGFLDDFRSRSKSPATFGQKDKAESQANKGKTKDTSIQKPLSVGEQMWQKLFAELDQEERELLKKYKVAESGEIKATLAEIKNAAEIQEKKCTEKKPYEFFGKQVNLRDAAEKVVRWVKKFEAVGDIASTADPIHAGLPWAGIKFILRVTTSSFEERAALILGMETSWEMINRLQVYMDFGLHIPQSMEEHFDGTLLPLQTSLVAFLLRAIKKLGQGGSGKNLLKAMWRSEEVRDFDKKCESLVKKVEDAAQVCHRELSRKGREDVVKQLERIQGSMDDIAQFKLGLDKIQTVVEGIWKSMERGKRGEILTWISEDSADARHQRTRNRVRDTCDWILAEEPFKDWKFVGAGKTFLTSRVIDDIHSSIRDDQALAYFYCDKFDTTLTGDRILRCFVKQLATPKESQDVIHAEIARIYEDRQSRGNLKSPLTYEEIVALFPHLVAPLSKVFLVLDGFDECDSSTRDEISDAFEALRVDGRIWIFVSGRPDMGTYLPSPRAEIAIEQRKTMVDIEKFITSQIEISQTRSPPKRAGQLLKEGSELRKLVEKSILDKSDGMFQWAALQMNQILNLKAIRDIEAQLKKFPRGLTSAYDAIFEKIENLDGDQPRIAERTFQWVKVGEGYFFDSEVSLVLAGVSQDYNDDRLQPVSIDTDYVLDACQNLILFDDRIDDVDIIYTALADEYMGCTEKCLLQLLNLGKKSLRQDWYDYHRIRFKIVNEDMVGLRALLEEGIKAEAGEKSGVNYRDEHPYRAFHLNLFESVQRGNVLAIQLLLNHGADVNKQEINEYPRLSNALGYAVFYGASEELVSLLLRRGANPNAEFDSGIHDGGESILSLAVRGGNPSLVKLLVESGANINGEGETLGLPLREALFSEKEDIMTYLFEKGADASKVSREWVMEYIEQCCNGQISARFAKDKLLLLREKGGPVEEADLEWFE